MDDVGYSDDRTRAKQRGVMADHSSQMRGGRNVHDVGNAGTDVQFDRRSTDDLKRVSLMNMSYVADVIDACAISLLICDPDSR